MCHPPAARPSCLEKKISPLSAREKFCAPVQVLEITPLLPVPSRLAVFDRACPCSAGQPSRLLVAVHAQVP